MSADPGLQPQRTALAWQRTGLSILLTCVLAGGAAFRLGFPVGGFIAVGIGLTMCYLAVRHFPKGHDRSAGADTVWLTLAATVAVVVAASVTGTALAVAMLFVT